MSQTHQQTELDANSQELTLNTLLGLVHPKRLMHGISAAAAISQSVMEQILQGILGVFPGWYFDLCYRTTFCHVRNCYDKITIV